MQILRWVQCLLVGAYADAGLYDWEDCKTNQVCGVGEQNNSSYRSF